MTAPLEPQEDGEQWLRALPPHELRKELQSLRSEIERLTEKIKQDAWVKPKLLEYRAERDAAIKAHDDMKECLGRKLKEAREEIERLKNTDSFYLDEVAENKALREALREADEGLNYLHLYDRTAPSGESEGR